MASLRFALLRFAPLRSTRSLHSNPLHSNPLHSTKLTHAQYWLHATSAFLWQIFAKFYHGEAYDLHLMLVTNSTTDVRIDDINSLSDARLEQKDITVVYHGGLDVKGIVIMIFMYPVYVFIIRRMCGALRDKMKEKTNEQGETVSTPEGEKITNSLFQTGVSLMAIIIFLCFELGGCLYSKRDDYDQGKCDEWSECLQEVSERSERALMKKRILAMNPAKWLHT